MKWIYLSPHLDDAVFSCGGLIWEQTQTGDEVEIWTICAGDSPDSQFSTLATMLHQDWGLSENAIQIRREEDKKASQILGTVSRFLSYPDCIYRKSAQGEFFYQTVEDIFAGIHPDELNLIDILEEDLKNRLPSDANIVAPLGIGNHVDHDITRKAVSRLGIPAFYYADYPYARDPDGKESLAVMERSADWTSEIHPITENGIQKWHQAARAYRSQIPVFWKNERSLLKEIREFVGINGGVMLLKTVATA
jgi:LmbE family N-acetylglucosaminyl deacetylase